MRWRKNDGLICQATVNLKSMLNSCTLNPQQAAQRINWAPLLQITRSGRVQSHHKLDTIIHDLKKLYGNEAIVTESLRPKLKKRESKRRRTPIVVVVGTPRPTGINQRGSVHIVKRGIERRGRERAGERRGGGGSETEGNQACVLRQMSATMVASPP